MKTLSAFSLVLLLLCMSCDPCRNTHCQNKGKCNEGKCICDNPYTGPHCEIDMCGGMDCKNGAGCTYGKCNCLVGYEGELCDTLSTAKFIGTFVCFDSCTLTNYMVNVRATGLGEITLDNLHGESPVANVTDVNMIIGSQPFQDGTIMAGIGSMTSNRDTMKLLIQFTPVNQTAYNCNLRLTRQH